jgi:hypothetical protein
MNILVSSFMLAIALLVLAHSVAELRPAREPEKKQVTTQDRLKRRLRARVPADWDRIMQDTKIEKGGRKK